MSAYLNRHIAATVQTPTNNETYTILYALAVTYDHRNRKISHPVCSGIYKPVTGRSVVRWVTTGEYLLLYVFGFFFCFITSSGVEEGLEP